MSANPLKSVGDRVRDLRVKKDLTQAELAAPLQTTAATISRLEKGQRDLDLVWATKLAAALGVSVSEIFGGPPTIPLDLTIQTSHIPDTEKASLALPNDCFVPPPTLSDLTGIAGAFVADDSANRLYPKGSLLIYRRTASLRRRLRVGDIIIVKRRAGDPILDHDVMVGILNRSLMGDLSIEMLSDDPRVAGSFHIRRVGTRGFSERFQGWRGAEPEEFDYEPASDDAAEIVGVVVQSISPP
ncbi:MAG: helix-turn-helix domain-containing protein [Alphaproteobacteria bacterium]